MKQIEITVRLKESIENAEKKLILQGFEKIRESYIDDIYMTNLHEDICKGNIQKILRNSVLLRKLEVDGTTIADLVVAATAKIGEKISFRRFKRIEKTDSQTFGSYIHMGGRIASLVLVDGDNADAAKDVAMHAAAMRPLYLNEASVPTEDLDKEKEIMRQELLNEGKPADKIDNILVGKVRKYYEEVCLEDQIFVKAENKETVGKFLEANGCKLVDLVRFEVGEGMEKRNENFAEEVMYQING